MKLEYGDLWKFVVSAGIGLIGVELLFLWLLLKEPFDLYTKTVDLSTLTPVAQAAIDARQRTVRILIICSPWATAIALLAGIGIAGYGYVKWRQSQRHHDRILQNQAESSDNAIRSQTEDERADEAEIDGASQEADSAVAATIKPDHPISSVDIENAFAKRMALFLPITYLVERDMVVSSVRVDFLLRGMSLLDKDFLIELKYIRKGFNLGWLIHVALELQRATLLYEGSKRRSPNTAIVVFVEDSVWRPRYTSIASEVEDRISLRKGRDRIMVIPRSEVDNLSKDWFSKRLGIPVKD